MIFPRLCLSVAFQISEMWRVGDYMSSNTEISLLPQVVRKVKVSYPLMVRPSRTGAGRNRADRDLKRRAVADNVFLTRKKDLRKTESISICPAFSFNNIQEDYP